MLKYQVKVSTDDQSHSYIGYVDSSEVIYFGKPSLDGLKRIAQQFIQRWNVKQFRIALIDTSIATKDPFDRTNEIAHYFFNGWALINTEIAYDPVFLSELTKQLTDEFVAELTCFTQEDDYIDDPLVKQFIHYIKMSQDLILYCNKCEGIEMNATLDMFYENAKMNELWEAND